MKDDKQKLEEKDDKQKLEEIVDYVLLFIEFNIDDWYDFSMIDDESGEYIELEFDYVAKRLSKLAR